MGGITVLEVAQTGCLPYRRLAAGRTSIHSRARTGPAQPEHLDPVLNFPITPKVAEEWPQKTRRAECSGTTTKGARTALSASPGPHASNTRTRLSALREKLRSPRRCLEVGRASRRSLTFEFAP